MDSLILSLLFAAVAEVSIKLYTRTSRGSIMFVVAFVSLVLSLIVWMLIRDVILINKNIFLILPEMFAVCILAITKAVKPYFNQYFLQKDNVVQKAFLNEFFEIASLTQLIFILHIFLALVYKFLKDNEIIGNSADNYIFIWLPVIGIIGLILYENIKTKAIVNKLRKEDWIPIVNEKGEVTGKIAKSVSLQMKNKFLHPVVRVALICNGKVYLQERKTNDILDPGALDHPFEKYMLFNHEINLAVRNSIIQGLGKELPFKFLLKYTFENENTKRLIFLFASIIKDESELEGLGTLKGKFWSVKQVDNDFGDDTKFSECFQMEYEYLKNTVMAASSIEREMFTDTNLPPESQENMSSAW